MKKYIGAGLVAAAPLIALADDVSTTEGMKTFAGQVQAILNILLPVVVTLALLAFFWGLVKFIWASGDEKARAAGKGLMVWGVIALFVMVSIWGLVGFMGKFFNVGQGGSAPVPNVGTVGSGGAPEIPGTVQ